MKQFVTFSFENQIDSDVETYNEVSKMDKAFQVKQLFCYEIKLITSW